MYEFHISRRARERYRFDLSLFQFTGNVVLADFHAARQFAAAMNAARDLVRFPEQAVHASEINALGLIDEILHLLAAHYRQQHPGVMAAALDFLAARLGQDALHRALTLFCREFPPLPVYRGETTPEDYLNGSTAGRPHRETVLEELLLNWLANQNPACAPFKELFDDETLEKGAAYRQIVAALGEFFERQPAFSPHPGQKGTSLIEVLAAPARAAPHSLSGQLEFIRREWGALLGPYLYRLLSSLDLIEEERRARFTAPGPAPVPDFASLPVMAEPERFSPDTDWMPRLVLLAKNTYVWLDQLSKKYSRPITRLDQVPDEELDTLAAWGISGLWLIGVWERSPASARIKQLTGNPEAIASAYSLYDYTIARDLGGEAAYQNLRARAHARGVRLAADMVPNHTGVYSRWTVEHPDWYIALDQPPFPNYTFTGPDLSEDPRVSIFLEDHYYDRSDAAVVFKHVDHRDGRTRYIYHGNDGTAMPWNDTAQLNYLLPEVREAVIQTILEVARRFPIIRFDAAMTLAKKHFQRLWFPEPGSGGAVPSRAGHGLTREQFDQAMPEEFWRQVVDRVAQEVPDTLLLAEAFWLMEGYFVRTLGMHRVYNSAFMNMLRDEKNAEYRQVLKNTLEFDPEILKRYVNFMNNPDEETAAAQFGRDGKYFGVCTMMATLPGLPMFGHGQIEGLEEKYGMEYRRAYFDEQPDPELVARHEREIFPLLRRRQQFAGVEHFLLYDFYTPDGRVDENVFAYSNRESNIASPLPASCSLVVYHNKWAETSGWIRTSVAFARKSGGGKTLVRRTLAEGLGLPDAPGHFVIFREHVSGREYIRDCRQLHEKGLFVQLGAYQYQVFVDFRVVQDNERGEYTALAEFLGGRGVPDMEEARQELLLQPVLGPFRELVNAQVFRELIEAAGQPDALPEGVGERVAALLAAARDHAGLEGDTETASQQTMARLEALLRLPALAGERPQMLAAVNAALGERAAAWGLGLAWVFVRALGVGYARSWLDEWFLGKVVVRVLEALGAVPEEAGRLLLLLKALLSLEGNWFALDAPEGQRAYRTLQTWLQDEDARLFLGVNRYQGVLWYRKEAFQQWLDWLVCLSWVEVEAQGQGERPTLAAIEATVAQLRAADEVAGYQVEALLEAVRN